MKLHDWKLLSIVGFARGGEKDPEQRRGSVSGREKHTHTGAPRDFSSNKPARSSANRGALPGYVLGGCTCTPPKTYRRQTLEFEWVSIFLICKSAPHIFWICIRVRFYKWCSSVWKAETVAIDTANYYTIDTRVKRVRLIFGIDIGFIFCCLNKFLNAIQCLSGKGHLVKLRLGLKASYQAVKPFRLVTLVNLDSFCEPGYTH